MLHHKKRIRWTARVLLLTLTAQLVSPAASMALTTGPSQPEVQSFEPVGTTDMVDMFTGDFVYNIPLLDVEGYPVNISYHGGADMEQEASWVGLGWNINPGAINRTVRGMPDDFSGEEIRKISYIRPDTTFRVAASLGAEPGGVAEPIVRFNASLGGALNVSNYRGVSVDMTASAGVNLFGMVSSGINMGVGSQTGTDIDYNVGVSFGSSSVVSSEVAAGVGLNMSHGYNTRTGLKDRAFSVNSSVSMGGRSFQGPSFQTIVPIGVRNIVPVITNKSSMVTVFGLVKGGLEAAWTFGYGSISGMVSILSYDSVGTRKGYGYLYLDQAGEQDILDFTRDRDGIFNRTMQFLPPGNMTYDIYSVTGQGTGGSFRPFRNDFGSVHDPVTSSAAGNSSFNMDGGAGWTFEAGTDMSFAQTNITSGPWKDHKRSFHGKKRGSLYESSYFKQAGELTSVDGSYFNAIGGLKPGAQSLLAGLPQVKPGSESKRDPRANLIYYFTAEEASIPGVATQQFIYSDTSRNGFASGPDVPKVVIPRVGGSRSGKQISEVVQVQTDGTRYIYGVPAMNNVQKEASFALPQKPNDQNEIAAGIITYDPGDDDAVRNGNGRDHFYSSTLTPAHAHSYLLTAVLSVDYADITGDGPTDDDLGTYTKFNYTRKNADYRWRAPMDGIDKAQHNPGFISDPDDDKGSYLTGSREQWLLHSIETKNYVAEFYTSTRKDGKGSTAAITGSAFYGSAVAAGDSYKLDSIKLFNKHDRFINRADAVPVKTIFFKYHSHTDSHTLCQGLPNAEDNGGKLTLERIYQRYGNSDKSMLSPYRFEYSTTNPPYKAVNKDRWGAYKPNDVSRPNHLFPFVDQSDADLDTYAGAWQLKKIQLPSGGTIEVDYEADDYGYVQDRQAMEMFPLQGVGMMPVYTRGNQLYFNSVMPNLFFYFKRRPSSELPGVSFRDNYLKGQDVIYYNVDARLSGSAYEPVKGYAGILSAGICSNDTMYGYIQVAPVQPAGGGGMMNPAAYTAINFARYHLPHIIFPGYEKNLSNVERVLAGLKQAFSELFAMGKSPVSQLAGKGVAKHINLPGSFIRLLSPGMKKKGGGHRVRKLEFSDNWGNMTGEHTASYGKYYDYTTENAQGYRISSGVASYEPQIGGDENPFREPAPYIAQSGSRWPPNDPVGLYQEMPVAESLYPSPVVGYSKVTISSIHRDEGRSSQGVDIHEFYTAADFPIEVQYTPLQKIKDKKQFKFKHQEQIFQAAQGYTLVLNDMHGKPKRIENRVMKPASGKSELISYQNYKYNTIGNRLDNYVPVLEFDPVANKMKRVNRQLGVEADVTVDTREKKEQTGSSNFFFNLNTSVAVLVPIPVPLPIPWNGDYVNQFNSLVTTKVIQQYGIVREVESYQEGALTVVRNEVFDELTGKPVVTSVNNEYNQREYTVTYPASRAYPSMGCGYANILYEEESWIVSNDGCVSLSLIPGYFENGPFILPYKVGDEIIASYVEGGVEKAEKYWVSYVFEGCLSEAYVGQTVNMMKLKKRRSGDSFPTQPIRMKIVRSGARNQLQDVVQTYRTEKDPFYSGFLENESVTDLISIQYKRNDLSALRDSLSMPLTLTSSCSDMHKTNMNYMGLDSLNEFLNGRSQPMELHEEYAYFKKRDYSNGQKDAGLFSATVPWVPAGLCLGYWRLQKSFLEDRNWKLANTVTQRSAWGNEVENRDAAGIRQAAVYGYNHSMPVAVGQNSKQHELLAEGFEDYNLLHVINNQLRFERSPFGKFFGITALSAGSSYGRVDSIGTNGYQLTSQIAHTGRYSLKTPSGNPVISVPTVLTSIIEADTVFRPFSVEANTDYIVSYWFRPVTLPANATTYTGYPPTMKPKSNIIEGWQQLEGQFFTLHQDSSAFPLPSNAYVDDIRIYPAKANVKAFVYHPFTFRLIATLDENNYATLYEYDPEGNLIRTKRETERGIITVSESRRAMTKR